ncbi:MAG: hypothetical protein HY286_06075 [Planctomycetes bacterium]|nr:hypothetical protein [Planctomycetota bacterium]
MFLSSLALVAALSCFQAPAKVTLSNVDLNGGEFSCNIDTGIDISTPNDTPDDGQIVLVFQKKGSDGKWADSNPAPSTCPPEYVSTGSPSKSWKFKVKIKAAFGGRICFTLKKGTGSSQTVSGATYSEISVNAHTVAIESSANASDLALVTNPIVLSGGTATTFYIRLRNVADDSLVTTATGSYYLQIVGDGAPNMWFDNNTTSREITFTNGEASFTITARAGTRSALLVGFDKDDASDDQMSRLSIPITVQ